MAEPPVTVRAAHDSGPGNGKPTRIVIHATNPPRVAWPTASLAGQAKGTANYFALQSSGGSAHYVCDAATEYHCVPDDHVAWHAPPNEGSIGIEICAAGGSPSAAPETYSRAQWLAPQVWPAVARAAVRTAELAARFNIPLVRVGPAELRAGQGGVCGHVDVAQVWHQSDHSDPGPGFPWPEFMTAAKAANPGAPPWLLPPGHYYGLETGPAESHGGFNPPERPAVTRIQQELVRQGFLAGSGWTSGRFGPSTADAVTRFQKRLMPGTTRYGEVWSDDWAVLLAHPR